MAYAFGAPSIVQDGLIFCVDPANKDSFAGTVASPGTLWSDIVGTNDVIIVNGVAFDTEFAGYLGFDGTSNYATSSLSLINYTAASYDVWFKKSSASTNKYVISFPKGNNDNGFDIAYVNSSQMGSYLVTSDGNGGGTVTANVTYDDDKWHHVVSAFGDGYHKLYFDGELKDTQTKTGYITVDGGTLTNRLYIGSFRMSLASEPEDISCVKVYNKALSAEEVKQNYNALKGRFI